VTAPQRCRLRDLGVAVGRLAAGPLNAITDVPGVRVGHWSDPFGGTGCTVILCPEGSVAGVDVRGGAPGTIGTDSLQPGTLVPGAHAILLTGGSAPGLAAAAGVSRWLEERGIGFDVGPARVPIVAGAVLFDLAVGDPAARPDADAGYLACEAASDGPVPEGNVGAGTGATVGKLPEPSFGMKGGLGSASAMHGELVVGAIAAVNALGRIVDADGSPIAANRGDPDADAEMWPIGNTTLVCVATNARLSKSTAQRLSFVAQDGIALAVRPAHTHWDGDTVFTFGTGDVEPDWLRLPEMTTDVVADAIRRGVRAAEGIPGFPAAGEPT
jgi:L-aminopeptidase/D-esterase-like protein